MQPARRYISKGTDIHIDTSACTKQAYPDSMIYQYEYTCIGRYKCKLGVATSKKVHIKYKHINT